MIFGHGRLVGVLLACLAACATLQPVVRSLALPSGGTVHVADELQGIRDKRVFTFHANAPSFLRVELSAPGAIRGVVVFPSGREEGGTGGVIFDQQLTESGQYQLRITESPMGESWQGKFHLHLQITR